MHCNVDDKTQSVRFFSFALPTGRSEVTIAFRRSAAGSCSPADMRNLKRLFLHGGVPLRVRSVPLFGVKTPRVPPLVVQEAGDGSCGGSDFGAAGATGGL